MGQAAYEKTINISSDSGSTWNEAPANSGGLDLGGDLLDDTKFTNSAGYRSRIYGLRDWTLNLTLELEASDTAFTDLKEAWLNRNAIDMQYLPDGSTSTGLEGPGKVESFNYSGDVGDKETVEVTIQGSGELVTATA